MKAKNYLMILVMAATLHTATAYAQDEVPTKTTHNVIKLNYGPGLVYSKIYDFDNGEKHSTSSSWDLSIDYAHTFRSGLGFGLNVIQSHLNAIGLNDFYGGASVYYGLSTPKGWYFDAAVGGGYARNDYAEHRVGYGVFQQVGAHYKLSRHLGVGAELRELSCYYRKPHNWEEYYQKGGRFGTQRISLTVGVQYYF